MKKFRVTMQVPMIETFIYEVEADEGEYALVKVLNEDKSINKIAQDLQEEPSFGDIEFEVEELKGEN